MREVLTQAAFCKCLCGISHIVACVAACTVWSPHVDISILSFVFNTFTWTRISTGVLVMLFNYIYFWCITCLCKCIVNEYHRQWSCHVICFPVLCIYVHALMLLHMCVIYCIVGCSEGRWRFWHVWADVDGHGRDLWEIHSSLCGRQVPCYALQVVLLRHMLRT